jgi:transketolase
VWVEAGVTTGWRAVAGPGDQVVGIDRFGESGPGQDVAVHLGLSVVAVARAAFTAAGRVPAQL